MRRDEGLDLLARSARRAAVLGGVLCECGKTRDRDGGGKNQRAIGHSLYLRERPH
jgi:hypothetical protein